MKLVLEREQMFGPVGGRPSTINRSSSARARMASCLAMQHDVMMNASVMEDFVEHAEGPTKNLYMSEANSVSAKVVEVNLGVSTFMRAPGEAPGTAVLEIAMDELAEKLKMDPIAACVSSITPKKIQATIVLGRANIFASVTASGGTIWMVEANTTPGTRTEGNSSDRLRHGDSDLSGESSAAQAVVRLLPGGRMFVGSERRTLAPEPTRSWHSRLRLVWESTPRWSR